MNTILDFNQFTQKPITFKVYEGHFHLQTKRKTFVVLKKGFNFSFQRSLFRETPDTNFQNYVYLKIKVWNQNYLHTAFSVTITWTRTVVLFKQRLGKILFIKKNLRSII